MYFAFREVLSEHLQILVSKDSSRQLAFGLVLGVMLGLLPNLNLIAVLLTLAILLTKVNWTVAFSGAFLCSLSGVVVDPYAHELGFCLLSASWLEPMWSSLFALPIVPWTFLDNTVVLGNFLFGVVLAAPVYYLSEPVFRRYLPVVGDFLKQFQWFRNLVDLESDETQDQRDLQSNTETTSPQTASSPSTEHLDSDPSTNTDEEAENVSVVRPTEEPETSEQPASRNSAISLQKRAG